MRFVVILFAILLSPLATAQMPSRVPTVGVLSSGTAASSAAYREALERGLEELGWVPAKTIRIEYRYADGKLEQLDKLARDLVRLGVDVIVAWAFPSIQAAKQATATIPIVMSASGQDPVQAGFVASLARPERNITGLTLLNQDLRPKQLQLLKEIVPRLSGVVVLGSRAFPLPAKDRQNLEATAEALGLRLQFVDVLVADDLDQAFADVARAGANGLLVRADPFVLEPNTRRVVALALKTRLPAIYWLRTYPLAGGLMSYGADLIDIHRRSAYFVNRLLRGARPADLPVEEPTRLALFVNVKTARSIGLTISLSILTRADEVIQ